MKNIWRIFSGDMKRLVRNPFALVIAIGLCIIPSLYAWFNIYSNWDPYANTKNIKIAVATEDTGYQMDDGTTVNMGDSVIESLKEASLSVNFDPHFFHTASAVIVDKTVRI